MTPYPYDPRYVYRVPGPVSDAACAALNERYGPAGWYSPEAEARAARLRRAAYPSFFEPSYAFRPYIPVVYLEFPTRLKVRAEEPDEAVRFPGDFPRTKF